MPDGFSFAEALQPAQPKGFSFAEALEPPPGAGHWAAPPGGDLSAQASAHPTPQDESTGGYGRNIAAGVLDAAGNVANVLSDPYANLIAHPLAVAGGTAYDAGARLFGYPPMSPEVRAELYGENDQPQVGTRAISDIGQALGGDRMDPAKVTADTAGQRLAREAVGGAGSLAAIGPGGALAPVVGAAGAIGGDVAGQMAPDWLKPGAQLAGNVVAGAAVLPFAGRLPTITAREVQARDGVPIMEAWSRANAENTGRAVAKIGQATDINSAIDAFGKAAGEPGEAPPLQGDLFGQQPVAAEPAAPSGAAPVPATSAPRSPPAEPSSIPKTSAEAKAVASAYYQKADQVGGTLLPEFTNKFVDQAESIAPQTPEGRAIAGDTAITGLVERIQALRDQPISLQGAQEIDERLGDMIDKEFGLKGLSKEGHNLLDLQTTFRNMILDAGPEDTANGTAGFEAIKQGRVAWSQAMKMMDFERILNRAEQTDNPVTSIRAGIRALTSNPSRIRGYSPDEIAALKDAANRGALGSVLHVFGSRLAPLAVGAAGMSGGVIPGLIGAGVTHGLTSMMRSGATKLQMGRANDAMAVLGGRVPPMPP